MPLYFAYGSNMSAAQMAERCPGAQAAGTARLGGYGFRVSTHGGANIVPRAEDEVHGVLWRCMPRHITTLDRYEGVRVGTYFRRYVTVETDAKETLRVLTYIGTRTYPGPARVNYMLTAVIPGAIAHGLPDHYVGELQSWMPRLAIGDKRTRYRGRKR